MKEKSIYRPPDRILETVLYCDDLEKSGIFYEKVIRLNLVSSQPDRHRFYQLQQGMLLLFRAHVTKSETVTVAGKTIPKHGMLGNGHLAFATEPEQLIVMAERLAAFQIPIESEIVWPSGGKSLYCRDPAGNSIEFATPQIWFEHDR